MSAANARAAPVRPEIHLIDVEAERLASMAIALADSAPEVSELLLGEIDRAVIHASETLPDAVVTMNATVEFLDEAAGRSRIVQLVYPSEADIASGKISVMTPVGAGLIGLAKGQAILWPDRDGDERLLRILDVWRS